MFYRAKPKKKGNFNKNNLNLNNSRGRETKEHTPLAREASLGVICVGMTWSECTPSAIFASGQNFFLSSLNPPNNTDLATGTARVKDTSESRALGDKILFLSISYFWWTQWDKIFRSASACLSSYFASSSSSSSSSTSVDESLASSKWI